MIASGKIKLECNGNAMTLKAGPRVVTILPGQPHRFKGLKDSVIMEISTYHSDSDVVRLEESKA